MSKIVFLGTLVLFAIGLYMSAAPVALAVCGIGFAAGLICGKIEEAVRSNEKYKFKRTRHVR
jgi:hypothetical protein